MQDRDRSPDKTVAQEVEKLRQARQDTMQTMAERASRAYERPLSPPQTPSQTKPESWRLVGSQSGREQEAFGEAVNAFRRNGATADGPPIDPKVREQIVNVVGESPAKTSNTDLGKSGLAYHGPRSDSSLSEQEPPANQNQNVSTDRSSHVEHDAPQQSGDASPQKMSATQAARAQAKQAVQQQESPSPEQAAQDKSPQTGTPSQEKLSATQAARAQAKQAVQQGKESPSPSMKM